MKYTGKLFHPRDARLLLDLGDLSPIQGRTAYEFYRQLKRGMVDEDDFDAKIDAGDGQRLLTLRFRRLGQTAAHATFALGATGRRTPQAVIALLTGLDRDADEQVLRRLRRSRELRGISRDDFDTVRNGPFPLAAAFFTNEDALNDPLIHGLMSLAGAAFFDTLGLLDDTAA